MKAGCAENGTGRGAKTDRHRRGQERALLFICGLFNDALNKMNEG